MWVVYEISIHYVQYFISVRMVNRDFTVQVVVGRCPVMLIVWCKIPKCSSVRKNVVSHVTF